MKIGFCGKFSFDDRNKEKDFNFKTSTLSFLSKQEKLEREKKLELILSHNLNCLDNIIEYFKDKEDLEKMFRIGSDLLPFYVEYNNFYKKREELITSKLELFGRLALEYNVRLSFHPDQFVILNNPNKRIRQNSISEFEYHTDIARMMGYTDEFHKNGFACNIHMGGKKYSHKNFLNGYNLLSDEAKRIITIENDEFSHGLDSVLNLAEYLPIVLDIHHHWINTGEYIDLNDKRIIDIINSWRGVRPKIHYAITHEDVLRNENQLYDLESLLRDGLKKRDLRKHSNYFYNKDHNKWAFSFLNEFDLQLECKKKNQAQKKLIKELKNQIK
jgi:UV DNA damage endonuclease